jgi:signal transduction histidine kinase
MVRLDHTKEIRTAEIRLLYDQLPSALLATLFNAAILIAAIWQEISQRLILSWALLILLVAGARYGCRRVYLRKPMHSADSINCGRYYLYGVAANGLLWGFAGYTFFTLDNYTHQVFLAFVLMGMGSGAISTLSPMRNAYMVFLIPAALPYGLRLVSMGDQLHMGMAGMLVVYVTVMVMISYRVHSTVAESLRLRFDNLDLLYDLRQAAERQELANRDLAAEIAAKHAAQGELQRAYTDLEKRVHERTEDLAKSEEALRSADRRKDEFLAMLGHELRNPLAPIRNALELIDKPGVSDSVVMWGRNVIHRQFHHLSRLVDDLLDVSRIVHGKISLQKTKVDVASVINEAVESRRPLIEARHHDLVLRVPAEPLWVEADLVRLDQVICNLLNNAAKYSDPGQRILLQVEASEEWITLRVQDNGMGISSDVLPYVFDLFAQGDQSLARTQGGLGIGLTLVKRLVEMHGGRVEAHSQGPGRGSEFLVHLPRGTAPAKAHPNVALNKYGIAPNEAIRILVVDDNQDSVETLAVLLGFEGYTVAVALDGVAALAEAATFQPQVVLLDIGMPGMDGYQVARELRLRESSTSSVIIALSGYGQPDDKENAAAAGFNDHLTKPVSPEKLIGVVKAHLTQLT